MFENTLILFLHSALIGGLSLLFLRLGKEAMVAWLAILAIAANLFVVKQVKLFSFDVTCCDTLAVGYLLGLNLIQEFFGQQCARKTVWVTLLISCAFFALTQIHLLYIPSVYDQTHPHFAILFRPLPRLLAASFASFALAQLLDLSLFAYLRKALNSNYLTIRTTLCLVVSQTLDTLLFSFLGLFGLVENLGHIILFSLLVKGVAIALATPFIKLSKRVCHVL